MENKNSGEDSEKNKETFSKKGDEHNNRETSSNEVPYPRQSSASLNYRESIHRDFMGRRILIKSVYNPRLMEAVLSGNAYAVEDMLEQGADANITTKEGLTALMVAELKGDRAIIEMLLKYGANLNNAVKNKMTPLKLADSGPFADRDNKLEKQNVKWWQFWK